MENTMQEKRKHRRVWCAVPLQYRDVKDAAAIGMETMTDNFSEGGACFCSGTFLRLASRLVLKIGMSLSHEPLKVISRVAWVKKDPEAERYMVGVQFLQLTNEDKQCLGDFMRMAARSQTREP